MISVYAWGKLTGQGGRSSCVSQETSADVGITVVSAVNRVLAAFPDIVLDKELSADASVDPILVSEEAFIVRAL